MTTGAILLGLMCIGLYVAFRFVTRPQFRWTFTSTTAVSILVYSLHIAIGGIVFALVISRDAGNVLGYFLVFCGWFWLGALHLLRTIPRRREPPAFLMRRGIADAICLIVMVIGLALALG